MKTYRRSEPVSVKAVEITAEDVAALCEALGFEREALDNGELEPVMLVIAEDGRKTFELKSAFEAAYNEQVPRGRKPKSAAQGADNTNGKQLEI